MFEIDVIFGRIFYYLFVFVLLNKGLREHSKQDFSNFVAEIHLALAKTGTASGFFCLLFSAAGKK
jgi:ABC-type uncharacterized transport system permease subunit